MTISDAIKATLEYYAGPPHELPPERINQGNCYDFARRVLRRLPSESDAHLAGDPRCTPPEVDCRRIEHCGHIWISDGERHYDAECPEGVDRWEDLPFFNNPFNEFRRQAVNTSARNK